MRYMSREGGRRSLHCDVHSYYSYTAVGSHTGCIGLLELAALLVCSAASSAARDFLERTGFEPFLETKHSLKHCDVTYDTSRYFALHRPISPFFSRKKAIDRLSFALLQYYCNSSRSCSCQLAARQPWLACCRCCCIRLLFAERDDADIFLLYQRHKVWKRSVKSPTGERANELQPERRRRCGSGGAADSYRRCN